ncbi:MAG: 23S rRNA (adenine(2503)-C(2))-methyltransferase RlmN [Alphaproteobacteria bacterium]|nr:23S rRNA (adenine(2503)-C(2))-methyltransferase RlmN [Alphaproteobacteria bacterium]
MATLPSTEPIALTEPARPSLIGLSRDELVAEMAAFAPAADRPKLRARQLWHWIYAQGATDFSAMTTLSRTLREALAQAYDLARPEVARHQVSTDGTQKWLLRFADGNEAESVHIPESDRGALCVSSQVGCTLTCRFCHTGTQRWVRNLTTPEMVAQVMIARDSLGEWPTPADRRLLSNIVMMGMGEPLYNFDNVAKALHIAMDKEGLGLSKRRITLSTAGVVPMIPRVGRELGVRLAISLHAVTDELRDRIVPLNRKYPIAELMQACRDYPGLSNAKRITFEYVMLKGVNDRLTDAKALVGLLAGIPAKVNLIPFNPWPGAPFECSSAAVITAFADHLSAANLSAPVRTPRGRDILAACGQLRSMSERVRKAASGG